MEKLQPGAWAAFWQSLFRFQSDKITPGLALRNTIGVALPLVLGAAFGAVSTGLAVSTGALNVAFSDAEDPYVQRARRMLGASVLVGVAVFTGELCGGNYVLAVSMAGAWAFAAGIVVALSTAAADLGVISLVTLVVYMAVPQPAKQAVYSGLLALAGGLLQTLLALAFWPIRRYGPEQRALGELYAELAQAAAEPVQVTHSPVGSAQSTQAQTSLAALDRDRSIEAERYRLLLAQAERMRLSLLTQARLRARMRREISESRAGEILDRYFEISSRLLRSIADSLLAGEPATAAPECLQKLDELTEALRQPDETRSPQWTALVVDARSQMDALAGQLRTAFDLATATTPSGREDFERREGTRPWHLRLGGSLATLRANLSFESAAFRHAVRLAACVAIGEALGRSLGLRRSYWIPMTVAIVLKPDFSSTFSRGVLRLMGTFAGLVFATGLFHALPSGIGAEVALIAALMFCLRCFGSANYGVFVAAVTALIVVLLALTGVAPKQVMAIRGFNTAAGGSIALLAYWLWPTWERTQAPEAVARMLDAYRLYFRAIRERYLHPETVLADELDRTRLAARLARSNVEASIDRLSVEPRTSAQIVNTLSGVLASSHRLVHAIMALEAGLAGSQPVPARPAFRTFANDVELTLYYLAAALRGSPLVHTDLPNLREDHHALVHSGQAPSKRHALVNVETDRITNSLNTLSEELFRSDMLARARNGMRQVGRKGPAG